MEQEDDLGTGAGAGDAGDDGDGGGGGVDVAAEVDAELLGDVGTDGDGEGDGDDDGVEDLDGDGGDTPAARRTRTVDPEVHRLRGAFDEQSKTVQKLTDLVEELRSGKTKPSDSDADEISAEEVEAAVSADKYVASVQKDLSDTDATIKNASDSVKLIDREIGTLDKEIQKLDAQLGDADDPMVMRKLTREIMALRDQRANWNQERVGLATLERGAKAQKSQLNRELERAKGAVQGRLNRELATARREQVENVELLDNFNGAFAQLIRGYDVDKKATPEKYRYTYQSTRSILADLLQSGEIPPIKNEAQMVDRVSKLLKVAAKAGNLKPRAARPNGDATRTASAPPARRPLGVKTPAGSSHAPLARRPALGKFKSVEEAYKDPEYARQRAQRIAEKLSQQTRGSRV